MPANGSINAVTPQRETQDPSGSARTTKINGLPAPIECWAKCGGGHVRKPITCGGVDTQVPNGPQIIAYILAVCGPTRIAADPATISRLSTFCTISSAVGTVSLEIHDVPSSLQG